jgi:hypothetical protein
MIVATYGNIHKCGDRSKNAPRTGPKRGGEEARSWGASLETRAASALLQRGPGLRR